jgi:hypothetical protein
MDTGDEGLDYFGMFIRDSAIARTRRERVIAAQTGPSTPGSLTNGSDEPRKIGN